MTPQDKEIRVVIWSDLHVHTWQQAERPNRLEDFLQAIRCVNSEADQFGADAVIFAGDMFESKKSHDSRVWSKTLELLQLCHRMPRDRFCKFIYVAGNHDYNGDHCFLDALRDNSLRSKKQRARVYSDYAGTERIGDFTFFFVPYGKEVKPTSLDYHVMISHADFNGLKLTNGMTNKEQSISPRAVLQRGSRLVCFNGHIHVQQEWQTNLSIPVIQIGPPLPLHWGDLYDATQFNRGCVLLRVWRDETGAARYSYSRKSFPQFPRFYAAEDAAKARKQDFVRQDNSRVSLNVASTIDAARKNVANMRPQDSLEAYVKMKTSAKKSKTRARLLRIGSALYARQNNIFPWQKENES